MSAEARQQWIASRDEGQADAIASPPQTVEQYHATLGRLAGYLPGMVRQRSH